MTPVLPAILNTCKGALLRLHLAHLAFPTSRIDDPLTHDFRIALRQLHRLKEFTFEPNPHSGFVAAMDNLIVDVPTVRRLKCGWKSYTRCLFVRLPDGLEALEVEITSETSVMAAEALIQRGKKNIK
ncbi:hypothetical protein BT69DRAFT_1343550 [Atractiella rhizophila]|nr:hypothetical protein BT69DRAFT_1343550 [Atractiella rhizophila]